MKIEEQKLDLNALRLIVIVLHYINPESAENIDPINLTGVIL
jgi:hypothetical protein